jgi:hypothetical protein
MKNVITRFLVVVSILALAARAGETKAPTAVAPVTDESAVPVANVSTANASAADASSTEEVVAEELDPITVEYDRDDLDAGAGAGATDVTNIVLAGDAITSDGARATVAGSVVTIGAAGTYRISGTLDDGQIVVDTTDADAVVLLLSGADITSRTSAPIYVKNAEKTVVTLADGTVNAVTDGSSYVFDEPASDEPNAAIFSKDDLTINGNGSLTVTANYNNGIASKDDLKITAGNIAVNAVNDGIKGRDSIAVLAGTITVNAGADGLQANNDEDAEKGYIVIEGGTLDITSALDGVQAQTRLLVSGGDITISAGGGSANGSGGQGQGDWGMGGFADDNGSSVSTKGLKASLDLTIDGGKITIDAADDALHSNGSVTINGGELQVATGDDAVHADETLTINSGNLNVTTCYEGLESADITINDGTIHIVSTDDGLNAVSATGEGGMVGRPGPGGFGGGNNNLTINGGYTAIDALGDGFDINGSVDMTAGVLIINGPTRNGDGPLDYDGTFTLSGGFLVAVGSAGMAQAPSTSSSQNSVLVNLESAQPAGTIVHVGSEDGEEILTFVPTKAYQSLALSSPELKDGETYVVYVGGSATGSVTDSVYADASYSPGTEVARFTISSVVTAAGVAGGGFMGGPGGMRGGRGGGQPPQPPQPQQP